MTARISVEVVYALPMEQPLLRVQLDDGATVEDAIRVSGLLEAFPEIDLAKNKVGIFSKLVKLDEKVRDRDRVEIYRPLIADPKEVRRKRAEEGKVTKKGGGDAVGAHDRLRALADHSDGFELAQIDLELRGEGEIAGTRQSGLAQFKVARLPEDEVLAEAAKVYAEGLLDADPQLEEPEHALLADALAAAYGTAELAPLPA